MRYFFIISLLSFTVSTVAACSPRGQAASGATEPASQPAAVVAGAPSAVGSRQDAIATGRRILEEGGGFNWVGDPQPMLAERMTYAEAAQRIPPMSADAQYSEFWPDTLVWLVILRGEWDLMPMGPPGATLVPNRYAGCLMVLFTASDARFIAAGDTACPGG